MYTGASYRLGENGTPRENTPTREYHAARRATRLTGSTLGTTGAVLDVDAMSDQEPQAQPPVRLADAEPEVRPPDAAYMDRLVGA